MGKNKKKIICFVILSRANYSSIKSVMQEVKKSKNLIFKLVVGASAIIDKYGSVSEFIEKEGFKIDYKINNLTEDNNTTGMVKTAGMGLVEISSVFEKLQPNIVFTVGDRYETISIESKIREGVFHKVVKDLESGKAVSCSCKCWSKGNKPCYGMKTIGYEN